MPPLETSVVPALAGIVLATGASTGFSVLLAAWLSFRWLAGLVDRLVHLSIGLLLATALTHLLPEALQAGLSPAALGWTLLGGILALFALEKLTLIHHTHCHEGDGHHHDHGHDAREAGRGAFPILIGDAFHNATDGLVIAAAFLVDLRSGVLTAAAVLAHEVPHEIGDFMILLNAGFPRRRAFVFLLVSGAASVVGGVAGYYFLSSLNGLQPYALALAAASFLYIALSDLLPELMRRKSLASSLPELAWVAAGVVVAVLAAGG
jgi:zinc and cadmium transporter